MTVLNVPKHVMTKYISFDVQVGDAVGGYQESRFFEPGTDVVVTSTPFGNIGLSVCYDLRFPELFLTLRQQVSFLSEGGDGISIALSAGWAARKPSAISYTGSSPRISADTSVLWRRWLGAASGRQPDF